jgi:hypothetical protein
VDVFVGIVEADQVCGWVSGEMDCEAPGEMVAVIFGGSIVGFVGWRGGV